MDSRRDPYAVLGVPVGASPDEVKQAYRQLAKRWHPDRHATHPEQQRRAEARFKEITAAYVEITRPAPRRAPPPPPPPSSAQAPGGRGPRPPWPPHQAWPPGGTWPPSQPRRAPGRPPGGGPGAGRRAPTAPLQGLLVLMIGLALIARAEGSEPFLTLVAGVAGAYLAAGWLTRRQDLRRWLTLAGLLLWLTVEVQPALRPLRTLLLLTVGLSWLRRPRP